MSLLRSVLVVGCLSVSVGCGANVVFGEPGEGGSGGDGGTGNAGNGGPGPGPGPGPGGAPNPDTSTSTGIVTGPADTCGIFCGQHANCIGDNCEEVCKTLYTPGCETEADNLLQCLTGQLDESCSAPPGACEFESQQYNECGGGPDQCFTDFCEVGDGSFCTCYGACFGSELRQECNGQPGPGNQYICDCFVDGEYWGSCDDQGNVCSIEEGCCQFLLGVEPGGGGGGIPE
ncbi:MAG: hypothetical protein HOW73_35605 [Polyangiaceae bacterium]|nr:hypothetical protein [Polyangiaceae bacterium]